MNADGDEGPDERLAALYRRHREELIRLALGMTGDAGRAQEITQDAFARISSHGQALRDHAVARRRLLRVVAGKGGTRWRRRRGTLPPGGQASATVAGDEAGRHAALRRALTQLPARRRACLLLRLYIGLPESEAAEVLATSARAVRNQAEQAARQAAAAVRAVDAPSGDPAHGLAGMLRAALDEAPLPEPNWAAGLADLAGRARRRRLRRTAATAGTLAVAAAVAAAFVVIPGRHVHRTAPVRLTFRQTASVWFHSPSAQLAYGGGWLFAVLTAPGRLVRLDPATLAVTGRLSLGPGVNLDPLVYADGAVWVADSSGRQLWRIDPATMRVTLRRPTGGDVSALAFGDGALWLAAGARGGPSGSGTTLERIDPGNGRRSGAVDVPGSQRTGCPSAGRPPIQQGAALAVGRVILLASPGTPIYAIDPRRLSVLRTFHVGSGCAPPVEVAAGPKGLYAAAGRAVVRLDLATGRVAAHGPDTGLNLPELEPLTPALGGLWYTPSAVYRVGAAVRLDPVTLTVTARTRIYASVMLVVGRILYTSEYGGVSRIQVSSSMTR